jgi:hypothetical protein
MPGWNSDMSKAPRGKIRLLPVSGGKATRKVVEPAEVVVAGACGTVTLSHWLDEERRWQMFTRGVPPIAWMPKPAPVEVPGKDGRPPRPAPTLLSPAPGILPRRLPMAASSARWISCCVSWTLRSR